MPTLFSNRSRVTLNPAIKLNSLYSRLQAEHTLSGSLYRLGLLGGLHKHAVLPLDLYRYIGRHILVEASWLSNAKIPTMESLLAHLKASVDAAGLTRLYQYANAFADGSLVAAIVIQESHIILHGYADGRLVIDAYTCGVADPQAIIVELCQRLPMRVTNSQLLVRGLHENTRDNDGWCTDPARLRLGIREEKPVHAFFKKLRNDRMLTPTGWHGIAEFYGCDSTKINCADSMVEIFNDLCDQLGLKNVQKFQHPFQPQGLSVTFVAKSFHMTVHSWPELYYAPVDLYCSESESFIRALLSQMQSTLDAKAMVLHVKERGIDRVDAITEEARLLR